MTTASAVISSYTYSNDILGRRESISQGGIAFQQLKLGNTAIDVAYNDRSEVIGATYQPESAKEHSFTYQYDGIGNGVRSQSSEGGQTLVTGYTTNELNQYEQIQTVKPTRGTPAPENLRASAALRETSHDLDGNLLSDGKNHYRWNAENRLVEVLSKDGTTKVTYTYDYQGRRTSKTTTTQQPTNKEQETKNKTQTTHYLYDGWNLLAELQTNPKSEILNPTYYTWGRDLSGSMQGAGGVGGLLAIQREGETHYPAYDANGNVGQLVGESGEIAAAYQYDPFGNVTAMAGEMAEENPWRFSTKPVEKATGWSYYGFRYYIPTEGRWASRDPIEERGGVNLYGFVGNDGVGAVDVLGLNFSTLDPGSSERCSITIYVGHDTQAIEILKQRKKELEESEESCTKYGAVACQSCKINDSWERNFPENSIPGFAEALHPHVNKYGQFTAGPDPTKEGLGEDAANIAHGIQAGIKQARSYIPEMCSSCCCDSITVNVTLLYARADEGPPDISDDPGFFRYTANMQKPTWDDYFKSVTYSCERGNKKTSSTPR